MQEQATALQRLGELAGRVGRQQRERAPHSGDRAHFGDRHLVVAEHFQQQTLDLDVGLVDLVDQQHGGFGPTDRDQQRAGQQELLGEDVVAGLLPRLGALTRRDAQQLLRVVPLVERPRLVDALVALQPDQPGAGGLRDRLGELGLAHAGRTFDQQRLAEPIRQVDGGRDGGGRQVADAGQPLGHLGDRAEQRGLMGAHPGHPALTTGPARTGCGCGQLRGPPRNCRGSGPPWCS